MGVDLAAKTFIESSVELQDNVNVPVGHPGLAEVCGYLLRVLRFKSHGVPKDLRHF